MGIEYENIGAVIASDVKQYLVRNELCTPEEADVLCLVYQDQPAEIRDMSWWDVMGLAMKQNNYLYSFWEERAKRVNVRTVVGTRIIPALLPPLSGINSLPDPLVWIRHLQAMVRLRYGNG